MTRKPLAPMRRCSNCGRPGYLVEFGSLTRIPWGALKLYPTSGARHGPGQPRQVAGICQRCRDERPRPRLNPLTAAAKDRIDLEWEHGYCREEN